MIYDLLLGTSPSKLLTIRNMTEIGDRITGSGTLLRTLYNITVWCNNRRENLRSTYTDGKGTNSASPSLSSSFLSMMRASRQTYTEMAAFLYSTHVFDFGRDIEAVIPFLRDRNPWSRGLFREIRTRVRSPVASLRWTADRGLWRRVYRYLDTIGSLGTLTIIVEGGGGWYPERLLSSSFSDDLGERDEETMEWATNLPSVGVIKEIRVVVAEEAPQSWDSKPEESMTCPTATAYSMVTDTKVGCYHPWIPLAYPVAVGSVSS